MENTNPDEPNTGEPNTPGAEPAGPVRSAPADRPGPVRSDTGPTIRVGGFEITADWPAPLSPDRFPLNLVRFGSLDLEATPQGGGVSKSKPAPEQEDMRSGKGSLPIGNLPFPDSKRQPRSLPKVLTSEEMVSLSQQKDQASGGSQRWGLHVQAGAVTLFVGQTSAGKTTFLHNLAYHLAEGRAFLGIVPPRPLRVLYADYESTYAVLVEHGKKIGVSQDFAFLHPEELPKGQDLIAALEALIQRDGYDVLIVDPLIKAFPVKDENDNAEASAQMESFKDLARRTGVAIVLVHNSGHGKEQEAPEDDPFYGRGATARADSADVGISFRRKGERRRYLKVAKSRYGNYGERIDVEFAGELSYRLVSGDGSTNEPPTRDLLAEAVRVVREESVAGRSPTARKTIRERLGIKADSAEDRALTEALKRAVPGHLTKDRHGYYSLPAADRAAGGEAREPDERGPRARERRVVSKLATVADPTLDARAAKLLADRLPAVIGKLAEMEATLWARLMRESAAPARSEPPAEADRVLAAEPAAPARSQEACRATVIMTGKRQ